MDISQICETSKSASSASFMASAFHLMLPIGNVELLKTHTSTHWITIRIPGSLPCIPRCYLQVTKSKSYPQAQCSFWEII